MLCGSPWPNNDQRDSGTKAEDRHPQIERVADEKTQRDTHKCGRQSKQQPGNPRGVILINPVYRDSSPGIQSIRAVHCGSGCRDRSELSLLQPASESDCERVLAAAKEVTKLLRPVVDMPAGTVQIVFSDALLFDLCKCHTCGGWGTSILS
jgi:hypothetical protein